MKAKTVFFCNECGYESSRWLGRCPACSTWNSMVEEKVQKTPAGAGRPSLFEAEPARPKKITDVGLSHEERFSSGIGELDRVLGGGIVKGSLILVGGDPGIGKSTLLLQMCQTAAADGPVLYASAEESQRQIKLRADRLGIDSPNLMLLAETDIDHITQVVTQMKPAMVVVDSIQTVYCPSITSAPGSVSQVREATLVLMRLAKEYDICVFLVGHVTKDGALAGPRVLEHMVDCVLYFEGERHQFHRILRGVKNRFGSTNEIGVFEMCDEGLVEVENPSQLLLEGRPDHISGSCTVCIMEGTRPMLAEVQALVTHSTFPSPRRMSTGVDYNRVSLLMAVLEKRIGLNLSTQDAYVNVIGGLKIDEPAADLGVGLAIASSFKNIALSSKIIAIGEIGLTGEVRAVNSVDKRIAEAAKLGFDCILIPRGNMKNLPVFDGVTIHGIQNVQEALKILTIQ